VSLENADGVFVKMGQLTRMTNHQTAMAGRKADGKRNCWIGLDSGIIDGIKRPAPEITEMTGCRRQFCQDLQSDPNFRGHIRGGRDPALPGGS
jgi:hypothetical protein